MKPYYFYLPPWSNVSGGGTAIHRLAHEISVLGFPVYVNTKVQNPDWSRIPFADSCAGDSVAVYPEQVGGNPLGGSKVVRYVMHIPGYFGGPPLSSYLSTDILFVYSEFWNKEVGLNLPAERILEIPTLLNINMFVDKKFPRSDYLVYRGKCRNPELKETENIPKLSGNFLGDSGQRLLADKLNRCSRLYSYDIMTVLIEIARLCGCPVTIIKDSERKTHPRFAYAAPDYGIIFMNYEQETKQLPLDSEIVRAEYSNKEQTMREQIKNFIGITQQ